MISFFVLYEGSMELMGIVNVTPDSFYEESRCVGVEEAVVAALRMAKEGADILDIGGESTRPGAEEVSVEVELERVIPVLRGVRENCQVTLSIDTFKPRVAEEAVKAGATLLNDITGFAHPEMRELAAQSGARLCVMHMQGTPRTMQQSPHYPEGVIEELKRFFAERVELLKQAGVKEEQIILDPGIGFGKTVSDNLTILKRLGELKSLGFPLLIGLSRKSFLKKILNKPTIELLSTTLALNTMALLTGGDIIRVHDVAEHRSIIDLLLYMRQ